jgi:hypothetical protein
LLAAAKKAKGVVDACNLWQAKDVERPGLGYAGIGRGRKAPPADLVKEVVDGFRAVETGVANEVDALVRYLNGKYARDGFNDVRFADVQRIAGTCVTGCAIVDAGPVRQPSGASGFRSGLVAMAVN